MKFNKRFLFIITAVLFTILGVSTARIVTAQSSNANLTQAIPVQDIQRFATVIAQIKQYYIEPVTDKTLFNNAIRGMLSNLDPHSAYLDADDLRDLQTVTTGEFGGIGVEVIPDNGFIKVVSPLDDTPAAKAGLKAGDLIVRIDNKFVKDMTVEQAINMIRGKKGSKVTMTIIRRGESKPLNITLTREIIKVQSVKSRMLENGYGYVRIAFFQAAGKNDVDKAVKKLEKQSGGHLEGLVLDLRNNPGGLLDSAIDISNEFLDANKLKGNKLIVYTKGRIPGADIEAKATGKDILNGTPMVVLINGGSASASEIVAGALQDNKRAIIMGTKSFGKGSVQTVIPIDKQSAIKLTTALYYTPSGRSIQAKGIQPDIVINELKFPKNNTIEPSEIIPIDEADLQKHLRNGNKPEANKGTVSSKELLNDETTERSLAQEDYQLYEALNLLKGLNASNK